jgi:hypothetical protein
MDSYSKIPYADAIPSVFPWTGEVNTDVPENHRKIGLQSPEKYWLIYMYLPHKNFIQVMIYLLKDVKI